MLLPRRRDCGFPHERAEHLCDSECDSGFPVASEVVGTQSDLSAYFLSSARGGSRGLRGAQ